MIDTFLISDPPLKQVVSRTYEAGLRGSLGTERQDRRVDWGVGIFHTERTDDIINVAERRSPMFGFFQNAGKTLREGIEAKINYRQDRWTAYANYTFVDATYRSALTLSSPNNPVRRRQRQHPGRCPATTSRASRPTASRRAPNTP